MTIYKHLVTDTEKEATYCWRSDRIVIFRIGNDFSAQVDFYKIAGRFCRGWYPLRTQAYRNTGLFPTIDICLKHITEDFFRNEAPESLFIYGDDAKRNDWNSTHYSKYCVGSNYDFHLIKNTTSFKRTAENVVGVAWTIKGCYIPPDEFNNNGDYLCCR